ncbi:UNC5C-like protein [Gigantopelta aegis]|uniref:UNC5C-like protein n=1 Tax=Gigantopelta aegis TaxID=1735272 RepID=UPI001B8884B8|nr:UNC5C-like protein [Gigantopelta aegis]
MNDNTPKDHYLLQSVARCVLVVCVLVIESCGCYNNGNPSSSSLPEPSALKDSPPIIDTNLIIILFAVTIALLLTIALICVLRWCYKKNCKSRCPNNSPESIPGASLNVRGNICCDRHRLHCLCEQLGHDQLGSVPENLASHFPHPPQGQSPYVLSQPQNPILHHEAHTSRLTPFVIETHPETVIPHHELPASRTAPFTIDHSPVNRRAVVGPNVAFHDRTNNQCVDGQSNRSSYPNNDILSRLSNESLSLVSPFEGSMQELQIPTERSVVRQVSGKLLAYITHEVDSSGDSLILDDMGVSLHIPRNAVPVGKKYPITLALNWDISDAPPLDSSQAQVSPVIYCGPHGLKLDKPCILSYKHCAYDPQNIKILVSESEILTGEKGWKPLCGAKEEGRKCVVTEDECYVRLDHFSLITSTQSAVDGNPGKKWLQVAVFASSLVSSISHYQIRVYFFNKTPCNLQWAIYHEAKFGGKLACPEKTFLFSGAGEDMQLKLHYLSDYWVPVDENGVETVSFLQIWHNKCPHAAMCFKRSSSRRKDPQQEAAVQVRMDEINIHFLMYQNQQENTVEKIIIHMVEDKTIQDISDLTPTKQVTNIRVESSSPSGSSSSPIVILSSSPGTVRGQRDDQQQHLDLDEIQRSLSEKQTIPMLLKHQLILMLDPRCTFHHDWRELAARLGLDRVIPFLEDKYSPTSIILQHMENKGKTLLELYNILKQMEREDAASFVEKYLRNPPNRSPVECDAS